MSMFHRVLIAVGVLTIDLAVFFFPLTAVFLVYILLVNPPWFRAFLQNLNHNQPSA